MKTVRIGASATAVLVFLALGANAFDTQKARSEKPMAKADQSQPQEKSQAYLGIAVGALDPALASQLHAVLGKDQGVLVAQVSQGSPATKAGIQKYDILVTFDNQKLYSAEQLAKLVRSDNPGQRVALGIVRGGKLENIEVTLGQREQEHAAVGQPAATPQNGHAPMHAKLPVSRDALGDAPSNSGNADWERFDSLVLQKTGQNQFKVTIKYLNDKEKMEQHEFTGTREQIRKAIAGEKDLPASERAHLLSGLDLREQNIMLPGIRFVPGGGLWIDFNQLNPVEQIESGAPF